MKILVLICIIILTLSGCGKKSEPKYLLIDFAFDGDSTINTFINFGPKFQFKDNSSRNFKKKYIFTWII